MNPPNHQYRLISDDEAELVSLFRTMSESAQQAIKSLLIAQAGAGRQDIATRGNLSLVTKS